MIASLALALAALAPTSQSPAPASGQPLPEAHHGGRAARLRLVDVRWGQLVDVYAPHPQTGVLERVHADFAAGPQAARVAGVQLERGAVTGLTSARLSHPAGSPAFFAALDELEAGLVPVGAERAVPRDAVLVLRFDDLLDAETLGPDAVALLPADEGVALDARVLLDPNHGAVLAGRQRSTRVLVDLAPSALERLRGGDAGDAGDAGAVGLEPGSVRLALALEPAPAVGVFAALANPAGARLSPAGPAGTAVQSIGGARRLVRPLRVGPQLLGAGDTTAPAVLSVQEGGIAAATAVGTNGDFFVDYQFSSATCAQAPAIGDVFQSRTHAAVVRAAGPAPVGGLVTSVAVKLVAGDPATFGLSRAQHLSPFDAAAGDLPECCLIFGPRPAQPPAAGVDPRALVGFAFTEPVAVASVGALDGFTLTRQAAPQNPADFVVGQVLPDAGQRLFLFQPALPLAHAPAAAETYFATLTSAVTDLAGNPLAPFPTVGFALDPGAPAQTNGGLALRFQSTDEDQNGNPELRGQFLFDLAHGLIRGRPVSRFSSTIDQNQIVPSLMIPFPAGVQTPLNPLGAKLFSLYRYFDAGFSATDETAHNLDIESIHWSPVGGQVIFDHFDGFEICLGHAFRLPDEDVSTLSLLPKFPASGLTQASFDANVLSGPSASKDCVHPKSKGYTISPLDLFTSPTGTPLIPYPLNQGGDPASFQYFNWRDTAVQELGGPGGAGIDPEIFVTAGLGAQSGQLAAPGFVPSIGLPLLMEYKTFPDDTALGLNGLDVLLAINSSIRPSFRAFSAGGFDAGGNPVLVDPDLADVPSGGFDPTSFPPGQKTAPADPLFYVGQLDYVVRTSRVHSVWFDSGSPAPDYIAPLIDAGAAGLPPGTSIDVAFRGADSVVASVDGDPLGDPSDLDPYGDLRDGDQSHVPGDPAGKNGGIVFTGGDSTWKDSMDAIDGARFFQVRISFVNDAAGGATPSLFNLAFAFQR